MDFTQCLFTDVQRGSLSQVDELLYLKIPRVFQTSIVKHGFLFNGSSWGKSFLNKMYFVSTVIYCSAHNSGFRFFPIFSYIVQRWNLSRFIADYAIMHRKYSWEQSKVTRFRLNFCPKINRLFINDDVYYGFNWRERKEDGFYTKVSGPV